MTTTVTRGGPAAGSTAGPAAPARRPARRLRFPRASTTPGMVRLTRAGLVLACLAWGALAALLVDQHASAASEAAVTSEPLSLAAQQLYQSLADADVTASTGYLYGRTPPFASRQRYQRDIAAATADLKAVTAASGAAAGPATGLPLAAVTLAAGLGLGFFLYRSQRWLSRRTHRTFNVGMLLASAAGVVALAWMAVALLGGRADLLRATGHGSAPAETLAQADIAALQARGDETLNLISRTGDTDFQADFQTAQVQLSTLLTSAGRQSAAGVALALAMAAGCAWGLSRRLAEYR